MSVRRTASRPAAVLAAVAMVVGCGGEDAIRIDPETGEPDREELAAAECPSYASAWDAGLPAEDAGEPTPEAAVERVRDQGVFEVPDGEPFEVAVTDDRVELGFVDEGTYSGSATAYQVADGWLIGGAVVCD